jgi:hypothetical protein
MKRYTLLWFWRTYDNQLKRVETSANELWPLQILAAELKKDPENNKDVAIYDGMNKVE